MARKQIDVHKLIARRDTSQVFESIASFKKQIEDVFEHLFPEPLRLPRRRWSALYFCGMGGSALGADFIRSVYARWLTVPVMIVNEYRVPASADRSALVVVCSYSGSTEESLSCLREASSRRLATVVITSGGALARLAKRLKVASYIFNPVHNPSRQPRLGTGYTMTCFYAILRKAGLLAGDFEHLSRAIKRVASPAARAVSLARETLGQSFIIVAAEHLRGNAHVMSNQFNETAKVFAPYFFLSELNHHLLEGLGSLKKTRRQWTVLFLESDSYSKRMQERFTITRRVIEKQGFRTRRVKFSGTTVGQGLKALSFGSWLSYYQGILTGHDPAEIKWVDYFKAQLKN